MKDLLVDNGWEYCGISTDEEGVHIYEFNHSNRIFEAVEYPDRIELCELTEDGHKMCLTDHVRDENGVISVMNELNDRLFN